MLSLKQMTQKVTAINYKGETNQRKSHAKIIRSKKEKKRKHCSYYPEVVISRIFKIFESFEMKI